MVSILVPILVPIMIDILSPIILLFYPSSFTSSPIIPTLTPPSCGFKPFMEYAGSYALFNYYLADPKAGLEYSNLRLIRAFENGLDPTSSEAGFVLVHIDMVRNSGPLVAGTVRCLDVAADEHGRGSLSQRQEFNEGLAQILGAMKKINGVMETMWMKSKPMEYTR